MESGLPPQFGFPGTVTLAPDGGYLRKGGLLLKA